MHSTSFPHGTKWGNTRSIHPLPYRVIQMMLLEQPHLKLQLHYRATNELVEFVDLNVFQNMIVTYLWDALWSMHCVSCGFEAPGFCRDSVFESQFATFCNRMFSGVTLWTEPCRVGQGRIWNGLGTRWWLPPELGGFVSFLDAMHPAKSVTLTLIRLWEQLNLLWRVAEAVPTAEGVSASIIAAVAGTGTGLL